MTEDCFPMEMADNKPKRRSSRLSGLLIGALVGAGAALLAAPYSGQETRSRIKSKSIEMKEMAVDKIQEGRDRIMDMASTGADRATELKGRSQDILEEQRINIQSAIEGIRTGVRTYRQPETYSEPSLSPSAQPTDWTESNSGYPIPEQD